MNRIVKINRYLESRKLNTNIILINKEKVLIEINYDYTEKKYLTKKSSNFIKNLFNDWNNDDSIDETSIYCINEDYKELIQNDNNEYLLQMIYPIYVEEKIELFLIFFKTRESTIKQERNIRNMVEYFYNSEDYIE